MSILPEKVKAQLQKIVARFESEHQGEREAAILAATRILDQHGLRWCEVFTPPESPKRETQSGGWGATCHRLLEERSCLTRWEIGFISELRRFPRISDRQREILSGISYRVLGAA
jgi:hypothetical protein